MNLFINCLLIINLVKLCLCEITETGVNEINSTVVNEEITESLANIASTVSLSNHNDESLTTETAKSLTTETAKSLTTETTQPETTSLPKPFYHKTIDGLVDVVKTNIFEDINASEISKSTDPTTTTILPDIAETTTIHEPRMERLSDQIRSIINHYEKYGEVTIPNADVPDPMDIPDVKRSFGGVPTTFTTMKMYGMANFTIAHVNTDLNKMQVYILLLMKRLEIIGNYSIKTWFSKPSSGPFNVTLFDVETEVAAELKKDENCTLQASESEIDMSFKDATVDFKNTGLVGSILQGVLASAAPVLFEAVKPVVLIEINQRIRENLNDKLYKIGNRLAITGSKPPLDAAEEEIRNYLLEKDYDPYRIKDVSIRQNVFIINITEFVLTGLANFHRVGEVVLAMDEGTVQIGLHVAAVDLKGRCKWGVGIGKTFKRNGYTNFTIDHIQIRAFVNQSLNVKTKPILDKLDMNVGKITLNMEGAGRFDLIVEVMVNSLPDLIRHILVDTIEEPLKFKIQQLLNKIEPEIVIEKTLPELDNLGL